MRYSTRRKHLEPIVMIRIRFVGDIFVFVAPQRDIVRHLILN